MRRTLTFVIVPLLQIAIAQERVAEYDKQPKTSPRKQSPKAVSIQLSEEDDSPPTKRKTISTARSFDQKEEVNNKYKVRIYGKKKQIQK